MAPIFGFFGKVDTKVWYSLILLMLLLTHIAIGATVFKALETGEKAQTRIQILIEYREDLEENLTLFTNAAAETGLYRPNLTEAEFKNLTTLYKKRCFKADNAEVEENMWNYWTSFDFASTIITTIGEVAQNKTNDLLGQRIFLEYFLTEEGYANQTLDKSDMDLLLSLYKDRCYKSDNAETDKNMWNFWTSMDFASTIMTTVGYGGMAPRTETGKLFVIIYTIPGMLLMMSYLNIFSTCILIVLRKIIKLLRKLTNQSRMPDVVEQGVVFGVSLLFLFTYLIVMATLMHMTNPENDSMLKSLYFYVVTMTTVGFGDIAIIDHTWLALIRILFVFCIGLVMVSLVFNAIRELCAAYQRRVVEVSQKLAMKTLAVAKQHRLKANGGQAAIKGAEETPESDL